MRASNRGTPRGDTAPELTEKTVNAPAPARLLLVGRAHVDLRRQASALCCR